MDKKKIGELAKYRLERASDYNDFFIVTREEAEKQILNAHDFILKIESYINENYVE